MKKFQNKYRIASARASWWHYGWAGAYFITICTKNREHFFGQIVNGQMQLSNVGVLADVLWYEITRHAKNVELGAFVVMPNHIHGILILTDDADDVETRHALSLRHRHHNHHHPNQRINQRKPLSNNVSEIREKIRFHPSLGDINRRLPNTPTDWD